MDFSLPSLDSISSLTNALFAVCIIDLFAAFALALYRCRYISNTVFYVLMWNSVLIAKLVLDKAYPYTTLVVINQLIINLCASVYWSYRYYKCNSYKVAWKFWLWSVSVMGSVFEIIIKQTFSSKSQFVKFDKWFSIFFVAVITLQDLLTKVFETSIERNKPLYIRQTEKKFRDLVNEVMVEVRNSASNGQLRRRFHDQLKRICDEALVDED